LTNWQTDQYVNLTNNGSYNQNSDTLGHNPRWKQYFLFNSGGGTALIQSIEFSPGTDTEVFTLLNANITSIAPGEERDFALKFDPSIKAGYFEGEIIIKSNCSLNSIITLEFSASVVNSISDEVARMFNVNVSPNPASDEITIDFDVIGDLPRNIMINIIDNTGKLVKNISDSQYIPGNYKVSRNISDIPSGIYFIEYTVDGKKATTSITVAR
jgi:hypothetical protein